MLGVGRAGALLSCPRFFREAGPGFGSLPAARTPRGGGDGLEPLDHLLLERYWVKVGLGDLGGLLHPCGFWCLILHLGAGGLGWRNPVALGNGGV